MLLVTALSPPYIVTLAHGSAKSLLTGLGAFIIASGLASLLSGLSSIGPLWALSALAIMGLVGAISSWRLEEVSIG